MSIIVKSEITYSSRHWAVIAAKTHLRLRGNYMTLQVSEHLPDNTSVIVIFKIVIQKSYVSQLIK